MLRQTIEQHSSEGDRLMATLAQQWIQEGRREGRREGQHTLSLIVARRLLPLMSDERICAITNLTLAEVRALRDAQANDG